MLSKLSIRKKFGDQRGFTLIEIIAVLVILAVLAVVAVPKYLSVISDAKNKAAMGAVAEGMGRTSQAVASYMLNNSGNTPTAANITAILTGAMTDAGDFSLTYTATGTTAVTVQASGIAGTNAAGGTATGLVKMPQ
jgi:prepilin-type N-terminal cleavage/methylation domain-containing protein